MKTFPAICAGLFILAGVIALKLDAGKPGQRGNGSRRTVARRNSAVSRPTAEPAELDAYPQESAKEPPTHNSQETSLDRNGFFSQRWASMLVAIRNESNPEVREQMLIDLAKWMEGRDPIAGLRFLSEHEPSGIVDDLRLRLLQAWAGRDAPAAATAALNMGGKNASEALAAVLGVWASKQLSEAIAWVSEMREGAEKQSAFLSLALEAAVTDPKAAVSLASDLPGSPERDEMILHAAAQWAAADPTGASAWAHKIENSSLREQLLATIATAMGDSDPVAAATLAIEDLQPGKARDDALVGIVQRWAQSDPSAAAAWVRAFPEGALRSAAVENLVKLWAGKDPRLVGEWLNSLPPSASRNSAVRAYAEQFAPSSPREAVAWAGTITDPEMRIAQLESIAKIWMESDPIAATNWLSQAPFSQEARNRVLRQ